MTIPVAEDIMQAITQTGRFSNAKVWIGSILSTLAVLFLVFDGVTKVMNVAPVVDAFIQLGYPTDLATGIGILELVCVAVYVMPRTSIVGAILLTGYLGGAVSTHVRAGSDLFPVVFPIMIGALVLGGLFLRENRLRAIVPFRG
jgi:hypothetical protein